MDRNLAADDKTGNLCLVKTLLFIIQSDPYATSKVSDAIDMAYAAAVFEIEVAVLFSGAALSCLLQGHQSRLLDKKSIEKKILALPIYGVDELRYVVDANSPFASMLAGIADPLPESEQAAYMAGFQEIQVF